MQALDAHLGRDGFTLRGTAVSRVDGFSDVVFGFALTLLVVSLEVPHTFAELHESLREFLPFAVCFALLFNLWFTHYEFFRRFGLHDVTTISLNAALLFFTLFYVYPLKFLFTLLLGHASPVRPVLDSAYQVRELMLLYGAGFTIIYLLFTALYANAYRQRAALLLSPLETLLARTYIVDVAGMTAIGVVSCIVALALPPPRCRTRWIVLLSDSSLQDATRPLVGKAGKSRAQ